MTKVCKKCELEKNINEFNKLWCKSCTKEYNKNYYKNNQSYFKKKRDEWDIENRDYKNEYSLKNYHNNKEFYSNKSKEYREKNRERLNENKKSWDKSRPIEEKRRYRNEYSKKKKKEDMIYNLKCHMRSYISLILKNKGFNKNSRTSEILGCSFDEFKLYLESKFEDWMTWENKGLYNGELNYGWDIDHIIPSSTAKNENDIYHLSHYSNLQPLCSKTNRDIKKDKIKNPQ